VFSFRAPAGGGLTKAWPSPATNFQLSAFSTFTAALGASIPDKTSLLISRALLSRPDPEGPQPDNEGMFWKLESGEYCANRRRLSDECRGLLFLSKQDSPTCEGNFRYYTTNAMHQKSYSVRRPMTNPGPGSWSPYQPASQPASHAAHGAVFSSSLPRPASRISALSLVEKKKTQVGGQQMVGGILLDPGSPRMMGITGSDCERTTVYRPQQPSVFQYITHGAHGVLPNRIMSKV